MKKSFVLYADFKATLDKLPDAEAGKLFKLIIDFANGFDVAPDSLLLEIAFEPIKQQMIRDNEKYNEELEKRRIAGRLGGLAKASSAKQKVANLASAKSATKNVANLGDNVNVNDTVNVNVNENDIILLPETKVSEASKTKGKHLFKNSPYFDYETFLNAFKQTKCFARHPAINIELLYDKLVNSEARNTMYTNWIMAASNWVERDPKQFIKSVASVIKSNPAAPLMTKGDMIRAERDAKLEMQRKLIQYDPNDPYAYPPQ